MPEERLQKVLARAGVASRRKAEELIRQGRVEVNRRVVTELGVKVDPERDEIRVDGERIRPDRLKRRYVVLNKPRGVITTVRDPFGRPTVMDLVPKAREHALVPVGRLDEESEGLLILTNDGDLVNRLTHPRYGHEKEYRVEVYGTPDERDLKAIRRGIVLEDGRTAPAKAWVERRGEHTSTLRIVLREGRKRQIRRMMKALGHPVKRLVRLRVGNLTLSGLSPGAWRELTPEEVERLKAESAPVSTRTKRRRRRRP